MDVKPKDEISEMETTSDLSSIGSSWLSSATDAKLLHLEQVALTREIDWLLRNEFPFIFLFSIFIRVFPSLQLVTVMSSIHKSVGSAGTGCSS
jgi:hypothetical protein